MADNVRLSAGTNDGATLRTYEQADGVEWAASVVAYVTTASPGANVLQHVAVGNGLPVKQDGNWTVIPSDTANTTPWVFSIKQGGNTATVSSGGALKVEGDIAVDSITSITDPVTVVQDTQGDLLCTAFQGGAWTVAATQSGTWNVGTVTTLSTITNPVAVTQSGSWTVGATQSGTWTVGLSSAQTLANVTTLGTITNPVTVAQSTAANLLCTASQGGTWTIDSITDPVAATQSGTWTVALASSQTLANVTTVGTITNPVAATQSGTWNVGTLGSITNAVTVSQGTASNLKAEVAIASGQTLDEVTTIGSITDPVDVAQSGTWTVGIASAQTLANVTTVGSITNPVAATQSGTWNIGTLTAITNNVGVTQTNAHQLRTANSQESNSMYAGATAVTPKFAAFTASTSGDNSVVAAVTSKKIRVLQWRLSSNGTVNVKWRSSTTDISGLTYLIQYAQAASGFSPIGRFETASGQALNINLSDNVSVSGEIAYIEV